MVIGTILTVITFIILFALCGRLNRDPIVWCVLGLFITPFGAIIAMVIYTMILGE